MQSISSSICDIEYDTLIAYVEKETYPSEWFVAHGYYYVVHPDATGLYCVEVVPESVDPATINNVRLPFPPGWRGAGASKLYEMTHVDGLVFCEEEGMFVLAQTLQSAYSAASLSLSGCGHVCYQCSWACPCVCLQ